MEDSLKLRLKIGEIEFEAEGKNTDVEKQRDFFMENLLPIASVAKEQTTQLKEDGLPISKTKHQQKRMSTQNKKTKKAAIKSVTESKYKGITADDLHLDKYCKLDKLSVKEQVILSMFIFTEEQKGEWFSINDVVCILPSVFGIKLSHRQIKNIFESNRQWFAEQASENNKRAFERKLLNEPKNFAKETIEREKGK